MDATSYQGISPSLTALVEYSCTVSYCLSISPTVGTKIGTKSIGDRGAPGGLVAASNYFTILNDRPSIIKDEFTIMNDGNIPEIWSALENDSANWRVTGFASYNLSSMTSGGENEVEFDFVR